MPERSHKQRWQERRIWLSSTTTAVKHFSNVLLRQCLYVWYQIWNEWGAKEKLHMTGFNVMWNYVAMEPSLFIVIVSAVVRWVCLRKSCGCNVNSDSICSISAKSTQQFFPSDFSATELASQAAQTHSDTADLLCVCSQKFTSIV